MCRTGLTFILAALACLPVGGARGDERPAFKDALKLQDEFQTAIEKAEPAIACILVSRSNAYQKLFHQPPPTDYSGQLGTFDPGAIAKQYPEQLDEVKKLDLADPTNVPESFGSGVVLDGKEGLILTFRHVVHQATKIYVRLPGGEGRYANIHADDPRSDLAVLKLLNPPANLKSIKLGDAGKLRKGHLVLTLANPFAAGFEDGSPSASYGIISNLRRRWTGKVKENDQEKTLHQYGTLMQIDARLNLGCSGGAVINLQGEMIGLTSSMAAISGTETAGGFALPLDAGIQRIVEVLKSGKEVEYGFLGVSLKTGVEGAVVDNVHRNSPAARGKLLSGDRILTVNTTPIRDSDDVFLALGTLLAGSEATLEVRSTTGIIRTVKTTLAKFYVPNKSIASSKPPLIRGLRVDHASIVVQVPTVPPWPPHRPIPDGVVIREVQADSIADKAALRVNEIIVQVNGQQVRTPADFYREAQNVKRSLKLTLKDPVTGSEREVELN